MSSVQYLANVCEPGKADDPFRTLQLNFRRVVLNTLILVITAVPILPDFAQAIALLPQAIYAVTVDTILETAYSTATFIPGLYRQPPLQLRGPSVCTFFKEPLDNTVLELKGGRQVKNKRYVKVHCYVFKRATQELLQWIDENDGALDVNEFAGCVSVRDAMWFFATSAWMVLFLRAYTGVEFTAENVPVCPTVRRARLLHIEKRIRVKVTSENGEVTEKEEKYTKHVWDIEHTDSTWTVLETGPEALVFVPPEESNIVNTLPYMTPEKQVHGLYFRFIPGMFLPDPLTCIQVMSRYAMPNLLRSMGKNEKKTQEKYEEMRTAYNHLCSQPAMDMVNHLLTGIDLAIRGHVTINALFHEGQYYGFTLSSQCPFSVLVQGRWTPAVDSAQLSTDIDSALAHQDAIDKLVVILNNCKRDAESINARYNLDTVEAKDLSTRFGLRASIYFRQEAAGDYKDEILEQFRRLTYPPADYLPLTPITAARALKLMSQSDIWASSDNVTDLYLTEENLFMDDCNVLIMTAFGPTAFHLAKQSGTKFSLTGKAAMEFVNSSKQIKDRETRKGDLILKKVPLHNRLVIESGPWKDCMEKNVHMLSEGVAFLEVDEKAPTSAASCVVKGEAMRTFWESLVGSVRRARVALGKEADEGESVDVSGDTKPKPKQQSRTRRRLDDSDEDEE